MDAALGPSGLYRESYRGSRRKLESSSAKSRVTGEWCAYHQVSGHDTGKCRALQHAVEKLITTGKTAKARRNKFPTIGEIGTIVVGFSGGGITSAARKRYLRTVNAVAEAPFGFQHPDITFSPADFFGLKPHLDDPIVISLRVNHFDVQRTLLDQGSSADIIYGGVFAQLGIREGDLTPYEGTLVGFAGERVWVKGVIDLDTIFGEGENAKKLTVQYLVLEAEGSYNAIIGRNTLNRLCAVISTAHLAIKYPLASGRIGQIVVDQRVARECYCNAVDRYGKKNASTGHRCNEVEAPDKSLDPRGEGRVNRPTPIEETKELSSARRYSK
ncbi:uncharacterized protein LOC130736643 [Lotus japonicus]|uniref:uncharacterized protein LOC130736643 n=1 Tax=Lotus japonicus TaxID=34305 RepID=UPI00258BD0AB|nr:uncharacterized protein LOC130736643 [Lotus japonicus]